MSTSSISSILRMSGISSGIDTDSIIKSLMSVEQTKVDRVFQQKTKLEWQKDAHKEINTLISNFRNTTMSVLSKTNLYSASAFNTFEVSLDTPSTAVSLSANQYALVGSTTLDSITQLARGANTASSAAISAATLDRNTQLSDLDLLQPLVFGGTNGDQIAFSINGNAFTFSKTDSLQTIFNKVNTSDANVTISYSEITGLISLVSNETGLASSVTIENTVGNFFGADSATGIGNGTWNNGQDAVLSINGQSITRNTNEFTIDGISYKLKKTAASAIDFTVERNIDATVDRIKGFVETYNTLIDTLQTKLNEEKYSDYTPLTDAQKEEMSETEITQWETKAKSGLLHNDRNLSNLLNDMRSMLYAAVEATGTSLSSIGIRTGNYYDKGKISLDEDTLRSALQKNPAEVTQLFTSTSTSTDPQVKYDQSGFLPRLITSFTNYTGTYSMTKADQDISDLSQKITDLNTLLSEKEDACYKRFSAMESALSKLSSQSSWLTAQLGSNSSS